MFFHYVVNTPCYLSFSFFFFFELGGGGGGIMLSAPCFLWLPELPGIPSTPMREIQIQISDEAAIKVETFIHV